MVSIDSQLDFRGRSIRDDNSAYRLLNSDALGTPGFLTLEPKKPTRLDLWAFRVGQLLASNGDFIGANSGSTVQANANLSYKFKGGIVRVVLKDGLVEIEPNHPYLAEVAFEIAGLA